VWRPKSFADLDAVVGAVAESTDLDFKRQLSKPSDIAKDIAAMSIQGGVIAYGIEEDPETSVASAITPIPLHQVPEKIQNIVDTAIWPPLTIETSVLRRQPDDREGVAIVTVPPSPVAPHYTHDRFPARSGTTTRYLTEREISGLYEQRRVAFAAAQERELFADYLYPVDAAPNGVGFGGIGMLRLFVSPLVSTPHPQGLRLAQPLQAAVEAATVAVQPLFPATYAKALDGLQMWKPRGTVGWQAGSTYDNYEQLSQALRTSAAVCTHDLKMSFYATIDLSGEGGTGRCAYEHLWAAETLAFLSLAGHFLQGVPAASMLHVELGLDGLDGASSYAVSRGPAFDPTQPRASGGYIQDSRSSPRELATDPEATARRLLDRMFISFVPESSDTFERLHSLA
jgi:Schlafen, AlbA_2